MTKINKKDIIDRVSEEAYLSRKDAKNAVDITFDMIVEALENGVNVDINNFASFRVIERKERIGRDPHTHEKITIKGRKGISLKLSKSLEEKIKNGK